MLWEAKSKIVQFTFLELYQTALLQRYYSFNIAILTVLAWWFETGRPVIVDKRAAS